MRIEFALAGRLGKDPELKVTATGKPWATSVLGAALWLSDTEWKKVESLLAALLNCRSTASVYAELLPKVVDVGNREGGISRALLAQAVEAEIADFLSRHAELKTADGHRRMVRHAHLPEREVMTGIGPYLGAIVDRIEVDFAKSASSSGKMCWNRRF